MAEFALVAPIFLFVMLTLIEFGRAVYYTQVLENAARDGARYAIVHGWNSLCPSGPMPGELTPGADNFCDPYGLKVADEVVDQAGIGDIDSLDVTVKWCFTVGCVPLKWGLEESSPAMPLGDGDNNQGSTVIVSVRYTYASILGTLLPIPDFTVEGGSTLVVNN